MGLSQEAVELGQVESKECCSSSALFVNQWATAFMDQISE